MCFRILMDQFPCKIFMIFCGNATNYDAHVRGQAHRTVNHAAMRVMQVLPPPVTEMVVIDWVERDDFEEEPSSLRTSSLKLGIAAPKNAVQKLPDPKIIIPKHGPKIAVPTNATVAIAPYQPPTSNTPDVWALPI